MAKLTEKQKSLEGKVDPNTHYGVEEAIGLVKSLATAKFDETVEVAINLGVDPRHADQMVRGVVNLPKGTGNEPKHCFGSPSGPLNLNGCARLARANPLQSEKNG